MSSAETIAQEVVRVPQPTMADIADHLGISRPLVSIVLRNAPGASAKTRQRVLRAARELGYTPHQGARSLRQTRSRHLGVSFVPAHASEPEIIESVYAAAAEHAYQVLLSAQTPTRDQRQTVEELLSYRCAAVLALGSELTHAQLKALAGRAGVPTVLVGPGHRNASYDVVHSDGQHGIAQAVEYLASLGHRRLAYLHCPALPSGAERLRGFTRAAARAGLHGQVVEVRELGYTEEAGSEAARRLLDGTALPTAMVAGNDQQAVGAMWVFARAGVSIPGQLSVTGYDDTRFARLSAVDLTTASQDTVSLGRRAVEAAVRRVEQPDLPPQRIAVESRLVTRSSTGPPSAR
jgi:DNA-binding LacI/PurR family transcriptional regulator